MRTSCALRATFSHRLPGPWQVGQIFLDSTVRDTREWTHEVTCGIGCHLRAAESPAAITKEYDRVVEQQLPRSVRVLLAHNSEDGVVKNIRKQLATVDDSHEGIHGYVASVLHGCDLDDGVTTKLLRQEPLNFKLRTFGVACRAHHALNCGGNSWDSAVAVVTHELKRPSTTNGQAWGPIVGAMVGAACKNCRDVPGVDIPVFGIRVIGSRWTFLRADFSQGYLRRLRDLELRADDSFTVAVWGGDMAGAAKAAPSSPELPHATPPDRAAPAQPLEWGLDFHDPAERRQLMRMVVALGVEARVMRVEKLW